MSAPLARRMAIVLHDAGADLGDERIVIHALVDAGYEPMQIADHMDDAIEIARRLKYLTVLRDGVAMAGAVALFIFAWVATPGDAVAATEPHAVQGTVSGIVVGAVWLALGFIFWLLWRPGK